MTIQDEALGVDDEKRSPEAAKEHGVGKEDDNEGRYRVVDCTEQQSQMLALMVIVRVMIMVMLMGMVMTIKSFIYEARV